MSITIPERIEALRNSLIYLSKTKGKKTISIDVAVEQSAQHFEHIYKQGYGKGVHDNSMQRHFQKKQNKQKKQQDSKKQSLNDQAAHEANMLMGYRSPSVKSFLKHNG